jgi:hypothetical protein
MSARSSLAASMTLAVLLAPAGSAQVRQVGTIGLTVYEDRGFRGRSATLRSDTPNLRTIGLNDDVSSLRVAPGELWEVCEHANYAGRCIVVSGPEGDLRATGWNNLISSARRVPGAFGPTAQPPPGLELFSREGFGGNRRVFTSAHPDLREIGFNDEAQSLQVAPGWSWDVCADVNYQDCREVRTSVRDLDGLGLSEQISSVRPRRSGGVDQGIGLGQASIVLFDERGFRGLAQRIDRAAPLLGGFGERAESVQVSGGSWELCDRPAFRGRCVIVSGNLTDLGAIGLLNRVNSVRPVATAR